MVLRYATSRLDSFVSELERMGELEFPTSHSRNAVRQLTQTFAELRQRLRDLPAGTDDEIIARECEISWRKLYDYLPLAGFLLRSTNVRNAFEVFGPLSRIASQLLSDTSTNQTQLVLSSEWAYVPHIYYRVPIFPGYVFIGLPATESANPMVLPLAGHELGHAVWASRNYEASIQRLLRQRLTEDSRIADLSRFLQRPLTADEIRNDMFVSRLIQPALDWALKQSEETFCDMVGVRIFGTSFMQSFAYLLAPGMGFPRSPDYPELQTRAQVQARVANSLNITVPNGFETLFSPEQKPTDPRELFLLSFADQLVSMVEVELSNKSTEALQHSGIQFPEQTEIDSAVERLRNVVPTEGCSNLAVITNAAWVAWEQDDLWKDMPQVSAHRDRTLCDLVLKSIEVFEIEQILKEAMNDS